MNPRFVETLATFFRLGRARYFPGTVGTLGAIPLIILFNMLGIYGYVGATFLFILFGISVADAYEVQMQNHDGSEVVIDEVAGYLVAMIWMPMTWQAFLYVFLAFRFLDILKPFPISLLDKKVRGGFGVMVDDIVAGVFVNIAFQFIYTQTDWLGIQYLSA